MRYLSAAVRRADGAREGAETFRGVHFFMESNTVTILLLGDAGVGKSTFLSYVLPPKT